MLLQLNGLQPAKCSWRELSTRTKRCDSSSSFYNINREQVHNAVKPKAATGCFWFMTSNLHKTTSRGCIERHRSNQIHCSIKKNTRLNFYSIIRRDTDVRSSAGFDMELANTKITSLFSTGRGTDGAFPNKHFQAPR